MDYKTYKFSIKENIKFYILGTGYCILISWIFFRSIPVCLLSIPLSIIYVKKKSKIMCKKRNKKLVDEFISMLLALKAHMRISSSIESGFYYAMNELKKNYGQESLLFKELVAIINKSKFNISIVNSFDDFAQRTDIEEIRLFAKTMQIMKKRGGNLVELIENTSQAILDMARANKDVELILAGKINEKKIMDKMPLALITYISIASSEIISPIFNHMYGRVLMTIALLIYILSYFLGEKLLETICLY